jgi:hypothetical protein
MKKLTRTSCYLMIMLFLASCQQTFNLNPDTIKLTVEEEIRDQLISGVTYHSLFTQSFVNGEKMTGSIRYRFDDQGFVSGSSRLEAIELLDKQGNAIQTEDLWCNLNGIQETVNAENKIFLKIDCSVKLKNGQSFIYSYIIRNPSEIVKYN